MPDAGRLIPVPFIHAAVLQIRITNRVRSHRSAKG